MPKFLAAVVVLASVLLSGCNTQFQLPASDAEALGRYAWCADFNSDLGTNCGYVTLEQCRAAISGVHGLCYPNPERGVAEPRAARAQG